MIVRLRREYGRFITSGGQLLLLAVGLRIDTPRGWLACAGLIAAISLIAWTSTYRRARAIDDTPTAKIASAAQGYTELLGRGRALGGTPVTSPLKHLPCLWYRYLVERRRNDNWERESSGESDASFIIDDGSGECLVDPAGAEILPALKDAWTECDRRYTEWRLLGEEKIYALGQFQTRRADDLGSDREEAIKALLAAWKQTPRELLRRFDLDGNGELDMREWELARAQARRDVERMEREANRQSDIHLLRQPDDGRLYLISSLPPEQLSRRYRWWSLAHLAIFFGALAGAASALSMAA
ncbi:MAG: hypothetical protein PHY45_01945 [Rhodocyclaceae bacterium]|nr:hypothetical protein [Rhodocyclaceae bacterium]